MQAPSCPSGWFLSAILGRQSLLHKLISVVVAWAMIMSSMPVYGADQKQAASRDMGQNVLAHSPSSSSSTGAERAKSPGQRASSARTAASQRPSFKLASLHAPAPLARSASFPFSYNFGSNLLALPMQAADSQLQLSVGFADSSTPSANFPEPWSESNPLMNFIGGGVVYRAGAIRIDNPGSSAITLDSVKVDLGRPGPVFEFWQNVTVPANGSAILTQTQDGNFNTSASPLVGCGVALDPNETRTPKITVTISGTSTDYLDTAHVLDTGGFDSSCRGNQSLDWRPIGTTGIESPSGSVQLITDGAPHAVGTQDTVTVVASDAASQPLANVPVALAVLNGPNQGKSFSGVSDASGSATIPYSSSLQGTDLIQAAVKNASSGSLQSQQASTAWTSADVCPAPAAPNAAASRLIYVGQTSTSFGSAMRVSALLSDGTGNPLSGRTLAFTVAGQNTTATTDANGIATVLESTLAAGQSAVAISFAGDPSYQAAQLSTTLTVLPAPTLLRYSGSNLITAQGQQTVSAMLTDALGQTAIAGRTLSFTLGGVTASAITNANGAATATLNFATAPPTGAGQLQINFLGDASYQPSSRAVPVQIYQPMPFVIWGGNSGGLTVGQRVNFWGSQWESQVINGLYFGANPSFKGWSGSVASFSQCEANATLATLDMACWQVKPGQSFPPDQVLPAYIEVVVSTAVNKSGDTVFGNIACGAILAVDHTPPYGAVPGQDGFGTIAAVNGDCSGVFPKPAVLAASQQQKSLVLPGEKLSVNYQIANQGATDATSVVLNENFDQVTPATGTSSLGTIAAGATANGSFPITVSAISPRQASETTVDYSSRLAAQDGRLFTSEGEISFTDPFSQLYTPVDMSSFSQLTLPRLTAGLSGPTCIAPNTTLPYQVTLDNVGSSTASHIAAMLTLPDSSVATPQVPDLAAGTRFVGTVNWQAPGIAPKAADETTDAYLARLHAADGSTLPAAVLSAQWQDALTNPYGPVEQPFVTLTQRIPVVSTTTPAIQALLPNQKTPLSFNVSNSGTGNAVQVALKIKRQDGTLITVPNFSLPGGQSTTATATYQAIALAPKGAAESDADYIGRLQALNNTSLNLNAILSWTDPAENTYGPTDNPFSATEQLPILNITLAAPVNAQAGTSISYSVTASNAGTATASTVNLTLTLPNGTIQQIPVGPLAAGGTFQTAVSYAIPIAQAGSISAALSVVWNDTVHNSYGPLSLRADTTVTPGLSSLTLAPAIAGPDVTGSTQTMTATVFGTTGTPVNDVVVQFTVSGANSASGSAITDSTGTATFTYTGAKSGVDTVIANAGAVSSNTASITWLVPARNISTSTVVGRFFPGDNSCFFDVSRTTPPAFSQEFPTINFNPPSTLNSGNTSNVTPLTRPLTDITTDVNGNFTGTIQAQGNGLQAGLGTMESFNAVFTGSFVVSKAGNVTFNFLAQDGYILGIGGGASYVSGPLVNAPGSGLTPFENFPVLSAFDGPAVQTDKTTVIDFPAPGTYPFELDYSECQDAGLQLVMTAGQASIPSTGSLSLSPVNPPPQPTGQTQKFAVKATDAAGAPAANQNVTLIVAGGNPQPLVGVTDSTGVATFSYIGANAGTDTLQAVSNISGLGAYSNVVSASWVASNGSKLVVSAGPNQSVTLPSNTNTLPLVPTLVPISTGFNNAVGADYHQPTNRVVVSVNYSSGLPHNFELVGTDGTHTQFSNIKGLTDEVYIAAARDEGGGRSIGGFKAGEMFTGSGVGGVIVRISPDGTQILNPWVKLPGETGLLRGQLYIDRTGIFGGDLIVATTTGNIWRVSSTGAASRLANVGVPPEGLITVPADPLRYGPWAGKIVTGSENAARIFAIDTQGNISFFDLGIAPEHIKLATPNENYFGVDFSSQTLWGIPAPELSSMTGDLLIGEEFPGNLWQVHWNGSRFETTRIAQVAQWEGATMAPAGISQVTSVTSINVTLNGIVSETPLSPGVTLSSMWSQVQGPGIATFSSPNTPVTTVSFNAPGTYVLRLTGSDSLLTATSDVTVSILGNQAPVANAGKDQQANFASTVNLNGTASDDGLPVNSSLSTFWIKVNGPGNVAFTAPTYDASAQFSASANPNGPWTYGSTPKRGGVFTAYPFPGQQSGLPTWFLTAPTSGATFPLLSFNNTGVQTISGAIVPPNTLLLHPGAAGENSVLRWTAPAGGTYLVQGRFFAVTSTTTDVAVLLNSSTTLLSGNVNGTGSGTSGVPFTLVHALNAGDNVDFTVGFGTNNNNTNDSTGFTVTITQAGDPATTASFSMPGGYELRLIGYDGELFGFSDTHVRVVPPCLAPLSGLVGWWPGDGDARDLANANTGVLEGGVTFNPGKVGQAFHLNGTTADVVAPASTALNASSLTLHAWVFPLDSGTGRPILEYSSSTGTIGVHLWEDFNSAVQITPGAVFANVIDSAGGSHIFATGAGALQLKQWNHVALTYDQTTGIGRIYVNGAALASASLGSFTPRTSLPFYIGARPGNAHFLGDIDEPQVFNRALTPAEILSIYTADASGTCKPDGPQPPVVSAGLDQAVFLPNTQVTLNGTAIDPAGSPLTISWSVVSGAGPVIFGNPLAAATTATFSEPGVYVLRLTASNAQQTASSDVNISLSQVINQAPVVSAGANQSVELPINAVTLTGSVTDDGLPLGGAITQQWSKLSGPGTVTFSSPTQLVTQATFSSPGTYLLQLTASDSQLSASSVVSVTILQQFVGGPANGTIVQGQVPITLAPGITLASGVLDFWPASNPNNVQVLNPNTTGSGTIGIFDGTLLANGSYVVRLTATDTNGNAQVSLITLTVIGENKPGRVVLNVTDIKLPLAGIPISITRTYDSLKRDTVQDFGFGWSLSTTVNLQVDAANNVSFTMNGQRGTFFFQAQPSSFLFPWLLIPSYVPQLGLHGTLTSDGCGALMQVQGAQVCFPSGSYQPTTYTYTDPTGRIYVIAANGQIRSIKDLNSNVLTFTPSGITSSAGGVTVPFVRDAQGRITQITDLNGNNYNYSYDSAGNLLSVALPVTNATAFYTYSSDHLLQSETDPRGNMSHSSYFPDGRLQSLTDPLGNVTTFSYDLMANTTRTTYPDGGVTIQTNNSFGKPLTVTDPLQRTTSFTYDANQNTLTQTDALGKTTSFTYDVNGFRTSITDPLGHITRKTYNQAGQLTSATDALGNNITIGVDAASNPVQESDPLGQMLAGAYDPMGNLTTLTNGNGKTTFFRHDANGNLVQVTDPLNRITTYAYDAMNRKVSKTDPRKNTTHFSYDALGHLLSVVDANNQVTRSEYDADGNKTADIDALNRRTVYTYDSANHLINILYPDQTTRSFTYDFRGNRLTETNQVNSITKYTYDQAGQLTSTTYAFGTPAAATISRSYDLDGRRLTDTDARANVTTYGYDAVGRLITVKNALSQISSFRYDANDNLTSATDANQNTTTFIYDARSRLIEVIYPDKTTRQYTYDGMGNQLTEIDPANRATSRTYDDVNRVVSVTNALGQTTRYDYDPANNLLGMTDANQHTTSFLYDNLNRMIVRKLPLGMLETDAYDAVGNLAAKADFNGKITTYSYDALNRLLAKTPDPSLGESAVAFTYTGTGQRATMTDASGTTIYTFDARDRLVSKATPQGTLSYTYDAQGNILTIDSSNRNGASMAYSYDALNRVSTAADNRLLAQNIIPGATTYSYDSAGNPAGYAYPNGVQTTERYDSLNRLVEIGSSKAAMISDYAYSLGAAGNRVSVAELGGRDVNYGYDANYRLTSEAVTGDPAGNNGSIGYAYDAVGNRLQLTSTVGAIPGGGLMSYDANDRLLLDTYDANGNTISSAGISSAYDFENHLTQQGSVTIVYDGDGNRVGENVAGVTTRYLVDTLNPTGYPQVMDELQNGTVVRTYSYGLARIGENQSLAGSLSPSFYGYDGHGNVRFLMDATGTVTDTYQFDAFGNLIARTGTTPNSFLYSAEQSDSALGLYYLRARYLNSRTGRFEVMDPEPGKIADPSTFHRYSYTRDNPVNLSDPTGRQELLEYEVTVSSSYKLYSKYPKAYAACTSALLYGVSNAFSDAVDGIDIGPVSGQQIATDFEKCIFNAVLPHPRELVKEQIKKLVKDLVPCNPSGLGEAIACKEEDYLIEQFADYVTEKANIPENAVP